MHAAQFRLAESLWVSRMSTGNGDSHWYREMATIYEVFFH